MMKRYAQETYSKDVIDAIRRMAHMAEYRDANIFDHIERVRGYAYIIARGHALSAQEAEIISYACQLHDIGKVGLPDSVAFKTDNLSPYDWETMRQHTWIGSNILKDSPSVIFQAGSVVTLTHHERWDGSGYPQNLGGEDIPVSGRICALVDVFDALTTKRAYKKEIPVWDAFQLIRESAGKLFDPALVAIFLENADEVVRVLRNNPQTHNV
jgi:putative two-component system response regulator